MTTENKETDLTTEQKKHIYHHVYELYTQMRELGEILEILLGQIVDISTITTCLTEKNYLLKREPDLTENPKFYETFLTVLSMVTRSLTQRGFNEVNQVMNRNKIELKETYTEEDWKRILETVSNLKGIADSMFIEELRKKGHTEEQIRQLEEYKASLHFG